MKQAYMHLTNYAINKTNEEYVNPTDEDILVDNQGSKRTLASLYDTLAKQEIDVDLIKERIAEVCGKTMQVFCPLVENQVTVLTNKMELGGKPFTVLGFDILLD